MVFNSFQFLWLFPIIFAVYYFICWVAGKSLSLKRASKIGNYLLIFISYALYMQWNAKYALILLAVTAITYFGARVIENSDKSKKRVLIITLSSLTVLPLLIFKYASFICDNINSISGGGNLLEINLIAPIGISFYTFQALGYLLDVYHKRIDAEKNWWSYMLFVCFFPQILSGPISKASDLLPQIKSERKFDYGFAIQGLRWLLWGIFLKVVFADRCALYVNPVLDNYNVYSGPSIYLACICYTLQIYGDFAGYSLMAIGVARLMGFDLINNFRRPYLATSITDFWKRWHISLTKWLTTHVYIAMGGNRCSKVRQYFNIMTTFLVSGIWHGANWTFIVWGVIHGFFQVIEKALGLQKTPYKFMPKIFRICVTFTIVSFAWLIFRMPSISDAWNCCCCIFTNTGNVYLPEIKELLFLCVAVSIPVCKDIVSEFVPSTINRIFSNVFFRRFSYVALALIVAILGIFNADSFIYLQF